MAQSKFSKSSVLFSRFLQGGQGHYLCALYAPIILRRRDLRKEKEKVNMEGALLCLLNILLV